MKRSNRSLSARSCEGFAFLWVLLTIAILGVGLAGAAQLESTVVQRDKERELLRIGKAYRNALASYYELRQASGQREYPASLDDLLKDPRAPGTRRHLRQIFVDPMTGKADWGLVRVGGRIVGVHSLSTQQPLKQSGFEPEDMAFAAKEQISEWVFTYPSTLLLQPGQTGAPNPLSGSPATPAVSSAPRESASRSKP